MKLSDLTYSRIDDQLLLGDGKTLAAIGLWPHYGSAIAVGAKQNETRGFTRHISGPLAIYQTKAYGGETLEIYYKMRNKFKEEDGSFIVPNPSDCPRGVIVAICRIVSQVRVPDVSSGRAEEYSFFRADGVRESRVIPPPKDSLEEALGDYLSDELTPRFAWILTDVYALPEPIGVPEVNKQGLFYVPSEIAYPLLRQYRDYLLSIRPKCRYCKKPLGTESWKHIPGNLKDTSSGWRHVCTSYPHRANLDAEQCVDFPERIDSFREGNPVIIPDSPEPIRDEPQGTLSLF